jgi:Domain of unknown function (DUF4145)
MSKHVEPALGAESFSCPHCGAIAQQRWWQLFLSEVSKKHGVSVITADSFSLGPPARSDNEDEDDSDGAKRKKISELAKRLEKHPVTFFSLSDHYLKNVLVNVALSWCYACDGFALWVEDKIVYPKYDSEIIAHEEMPDTIKSDFEEAASIVDRSPRGAAALLRLSIQKIMPDLGATGDDLNKNIALLVKNGLETDIQRALDVLRVIGNNAVHPGQIDLKDDKATAIKLFDLLNLIVERRIATPKKIDALFEGLPPGAREQIEKRDKASGA